MKSSKLKTATASLLLVGATAYAAPWDIDLVDSPMLRGYEWHMAAAPEESVSINHHRPYAYPDRVMEEAGGSTKTALTLYFAEVAPSLKSPHEAPQSKEVLNQGKVMFDTYCQTCHGVKGTVQDELNNTWPLKERWGSIPNLANVVDGNISLAGQANLPEPLLYLLIRNGYGSMPAYGHAMEDTEIWAAIHYLKSLQGQKF